MIKSWNSDKIGILSQCHWLDIFGTSQLYMLHIATPHCYTLDMTSWANFADIFTVQP